MYEIVVECRRPIPGKIKKIKWVWLKRPLKKTKSKVNGEKETCYNDISGMEQQSSQMPFSFSQSDKPFFARQDIIAKRKR